MADKIKEDAMEPDYEKFKELMALWKAMPQATSVKQETEVEQDYERYDEFMNFWKSMPREMHVSWHEAFKTAKALPKGKRSRSELRRLVNNARNREKIDLCDLELKLRLGSSKWWAIIKEGDLEKNIPLAFARLLGMKGPGNSTDNAWQSYLLPVDATRPVCKLVNEILHLMRAGQCSLGYEAVQEGVQTRFEDFKDCLQLRWFRVWRQELKLDFVQSSYPTDEMRSALGKEFCDWVEKQDEWLWSEEV